MNKPVSVEEIQRVIKLLRPYRIDSWFVYLNPDLAISEGWITQEQWDEAVREEEQTPNIEEG